MLRFFSIRPVLQIVHIENALGHYLHFSRTDEGTLTEISTTHNPATYMCILNTSIC
ncbi:Unknown protein sequence [Pseudomonas coronafaciens pv. oryzae]|nr:Unknown protein sequence [Pseudomonas coronafaciens pv. oryzae]